MPYRRFEAKAQIRYGYEEWEFLRVFPPTANEQPDAPVLVATPGGLWHQPGDQNLAMFSGTDGLANVLQAAGYYVIIVSCQPVYSNRNWRVEPWSRKPWPSQLLSFLKALAFIAANRDYASEHGPKFLTSSTASISVDKIATYGISAGGGLSMLSGLVPGGRLPVDGAVGFGIDNYNYGAAPRPRACVQAIGQLDWTQFYFSPNNPLNSEVYNNDIHQALSPDGGAGPWLLWSQTPMPPKKAMSPLWWLLRGYQGAKNTAFYHRYLNAAASYEINLGPSDFTPGVVKNDEAGGKAFIDPHARYQVYGAAKYWTLAGLTNRCVLGLKPITYSPGTDTYSEGASVGDIQDDIVAFIRERCG